jgi:CRISPR-associated protein Cas1
MAIGVAAHAVTDDPNKNGTRVERAVEVVNTKLGYHGRCDTVEHFDDGSIGIVEYKATPVRGRPEVTESGKVQVTLQAAALEAMGEQVREACVYFVNHKKRVPVDLTDQLRSHVFSVLELARSCLSSDSAPPPLEDDPRCARCSHAAVCLPDERALQTVHRRIIVEDPDTQVVHLSTPGSHASIRAGRLVVSKDHEQLASIPIEKVQGVVAHGNVDLTGGLIRELLWRDLTIVWCTGRGRVVGYASSTRSPNGGPRLRQMAAAHTGRIDLAREFVAAKITNQATLLRRNGDDSNAVTALRGLTRRTADASSLTDLLGIEGEAGHLYFSAFASMLKTGGISFSVRSRRPALDPVNAALKYAYALLLGDSIKAIRACGLDPHAGFLHSSARNKPALALDLCEEFRAPVADSCVIRAFNNHELGQDDFSSATGATSLSEKGRKKLIASYEQRVESEFTHPTFGYRVTWRRAMEIQARLVLGVLDGTQPRYLGVRTR